MGVSASSLNPVNITIEICKNILNAQSLISL